MECQAPVLGHSLLRCAGLSRSQSRLQMLPATLYLLGAIVLLYIWFRLALSRKRFRLVHIASLLLCGLLDFAFAVILVRDNQVNIDNQTLGGFTSLVCLFHLSAVYLFLPPAKTYPRHLDRLLFGAMIASAVLNILACVQVDSNVNAGIIYAEAACLLAFYLACFCASQYSRFFVKIGRTGMMEQHQPLPIIPTMTLLLALAFFTVQACIAMAVPGAYRLHMASSVLSSMGYLLLIMTFGLSPLGVSKQDSSSSTASPPPARDTSTDPPSEKSGTKDQSVEKEAETGERVVTIGVTPPAPALEMSRDERQYHHHNRSVSNVIDSDRGSIVWHGTPTISRSRKCSNMTTLSPNPDFHSRRSRSQSGLSLTSWDRLQHLMSRGKARPTSGVTYYGSESSYADNGMQRRSSIMSTFAYAAAGWGTPAQQQEHQAPPPVPPIDPRFLASTSQVELGLAITLSEEKGPIVLQADRIASSVEASVDPSSSSRSDLASVTTPSKAKDVASSRPGLRGALMNLSSIFSSADRDTSKTSLRESNTPESCATLAKERQGSFPARYQHSKLFPAPGISTEETITPPHDSDFNSPHDSDFKHSMQVTAHLQDPQQQRPLSDLQETLASPSSASSPKRCKVIRRVSLGEDERTQAMGSILFPKNKGSAPCTGK